MSGRDAAQTRAPGMHLCRLAAAVCLTAAALALSGCDAEKIGSARGEARIRVGAHALTVAEGGAPAAYALVLVRQPADTVWVLVASAERAVETIPDSLCFTTSDWDRPRAVVVRAVDDRLVQGDHHDVLGHKVESLDAAFHELQVPVVTVRIVDNDAAAMSVTPTELNLVEGGPPGVYSLALTVRPTADVRITTTAVPASVGLEVAPDTLVFTADDWELPRQVSVLAVADGLLEDSPQLAVIAHAVASTDTSYAAAAAPSVVVRASDVSAPFLSVIGVLAREGDGDVDVLVRLSASVGEEVRVDLATTNGSALAGYDYAPLDTTLAFAPGVTEATVPIAIVDDNWPESGEFFNVVLEAAEHALVGVGGAICYIDDDDRPVLSVANASVNEAEGPLVFHVSLSATSPLDVRVTASTVAGSAAAGIDYTSRTQTLTIAAGATSVVITVPVIDDAAPEADELLFLALSAPDNAVIGNGLAAGTIVDDDGGIIFASDVAVSEGDGVATFVLTLTEAAPSPVQVEVATAGAEAMPALDFAAVSRTVTIPAGQLSLAVPVTLVDDGTPELTESFTLVLRNPVGATLLDSTATCTIEDDDEPELTIADVSVPENGGSAVFVLTLSVAAPWPVSATVTTQPGTATTPADFTPVATVVTLSAGQVEADIVVSIVNDAAPEGDEWFLVQTSNVSGATVGTTTARCTIEDNDFPLLSVGDALGYEGAGTITFTILLSGPSGVDVTVRVDTQNLVAVEGSDFVGWHGTVTIPAGRTAATVAVVLIDNTISEPDEPFVLLLTEAQNAGYLDASALGIIVDDD